MRFSHRVAAGALGLVVAASPTGATQATASPATARPAASASPRAAGNSGWFDCSRPGEGFGIHQATFAPAHPVAENLTINLTGFLNEPVDREAVGRVILHYNSTTIEQDYRVGDWTAVPIFEGPAALPVVLKAPGGQWPRTDIDIDARVYNPDTSRILCLKAFIDLTP